MRLSENLSHAPTIGRACEITGLTARAIRHYERTGLISPWRDDGGYRRYSRDIQSKLTMIAELRCAGLRLSEIREVLDAGQTPARAALAEAKLRVRLDQLARAKRHAEAMLERVLAGSFGAIGERPFHMMPAQGFGKIAAE